MADNIDVTPGVGKTFAADDVSGVLYPRAKMVIGADGSASDVHAGNPVPVTQADAATATLQASILSGLGSIFSAMATASGQGSTNGALASILSAMATSSLQGTGNTTLASILAAMATAAKQDTGNTSLASILSGMATATLQGTGNTTLASILSGMATATLQGTGNTALASILTAMATAAKQDTGNTSLATLAGAITSAKMQVNTITQPARVRTTDSVSSALATDKIMNNNTELTPKYAFVNVTPSQTDSSLVAAVSGKRIRVLNYTAIAGNTQTDLTFNTKPVGAGSAITSKKACNNNGGLAPGEAALGHFQTGVGEGLSLTTGAGSNIGIDITYVEV